MNWQFHHFDTLTTRALYDVMKLRVDVFVVEQQCAYAELDELDVAPDTLHLLGYHGNTLVAYARAMPPSMPEQASADCHLSGVVKIGRVVVARPQRGTGVAKTLMLTMMNRLGTQYPACSLFLAAQYAIRSFYADLGFCCVSETYLEDGIEHINMQRSSLSAGESTASTNQFLPK